MKNLSPPVKHTPLKRIFDLFFSVLALILTMPLLLLIAMAIRLTSSGPIIYSHERIGRGGKPFRCYKFRTMYEDADIRLQELLGCNPVMHAEWKITRKLKQDPRITPIGRFLRQSSLDEFPQFWNVFRGDLSIVGPRPVIQEEVIQCLGDKAPKILSIRPGLTGLWQLSGRNDTSYSKRLQLDEEYVDNLSLMLDLKLILKTIPQMIFPKGAY